MSSVDVVNWDNKKVGSVELNADVFDGPVRKDVLHTIVKWQLASRRQGTHNTLTRAEVKGSGKKPFKQKGTGNARQGSNQSPLKPGGGIIFGPKTRDYSYDLPKKVKKLGLRSALSYLNKEGKLTVIDSLTSAEGKTKELAANLKKLGKEKALLVDAEANELCKRASRNLKSVNYIPVAGLNVYDMLKYDNLIVSKDCIDKIVERCGVK